MLSAAQAQRLEDRSLVVSAPSVAAGSTMSTPDPNPADADADAEHGS